MAGVTWSARLPRSVDRGGIADANEPSDSGCWIIPAGGCGGLRPGGGAMGAPASGMMGGRGGAMSAPRPDANAGRISGSSCKPCHVAEVMPRRRLPVRRFGPGSCVPAAPRITASGDRSMASMGMSAAAACEADAPPMVAGAPASDRKLVVAEKPAGAPNGTGPLAVAKPATPDRPMCMDVLPSRPVAAARVGAVPALVSELRAVGPS